MLDRIINALKSGPKPPTPAMAKNPFQMKQVAAAALMVEAARVDRDFDAKERAEIERLVRERFALTDEEALALIEVAEKRQQESYSDWIFAHTIQNGFSPEEQREVVSMLWEIAYADGELHRFEANTIEVVGERIGLSKDVIEAARKSALQRLGLTDPNA